MLSQRLNWQEQDIDPPRGQKSSLCCWYSRDKYVDIVTMKAHQVMFVYGTVASIISEVLEAKHFLSPEMRPPASVQLVCRRTREYLCNAPSTAL